jgi:hypothetical protein
MRTLINGKGQQTSAIGWPTQRQFYQLERIPHTIDWVREVAFGVVDAICHIVDRLLDDVDETLRIIEKVNRVSRSF